MTDATKLAQLAKDLGLTEAQRVFAEGVASGKSKRESATLAGSSAPDLMGQKWSKLEHVQKYLNALTQEAIALAEKSTGKVKRDLSRVIKQLWQEADGKRPAEFVRMRDESGNWVERVQKFKPQAARIALLAHYEPKEAPGATQIQILNVLPAQLAGEVYKALVAGQTDA